MLAVRQGNTGGQYHMNVYLSKFKKVSSQIKSLDNYCSSSVTFILHITIQAYFLEEEGDYLLNTVNIKINMRIW